MIRECIKKVLFLAMTENDSNEVAVAMSKDKIGNNYGNQHGVDLNSSFHMREIMELDFDFTVVFHNHPSTQTFSLEDLQYFWLHPKINVFGVVTNQGQVMLLSRGRNIVASDVIRREKIIEKCWKIITQELVNKKKEEGLVPSQVLYTKSKELLKLYKTYGFYFRLN